MSVATRKKAVFFKKNENNNPNFRLPSPTASDLTDTPKLPQLDDLTFGLPIYFFMFLYSYYNTIKDGKKDESLRYNYFSMFFSEFTLIDKLINGINTLEQPLTALKSFLPDIFNVF